MGVVTRLMKNELLPVNLYRNGGIMRIVFVYRTKISSHLKKNELIMPLHLSLFFTGHKKTVSYKIDIHAEYLVRKAIDSCMRFIPFLGLHQCTRESCLPFPFGLSAALEAALSEPQ